MFKITDLRLSSCPQVLNQRSSQRGSCTPRRRQRGGRDRLRWARRQWWVRPNVRGGQSALQSHFDCLLNLKLHGWSVITDHRDEEPQPKSQGPTPLPWMEACFFVLKRHSYSQPPCFVLRGRGNEAVARWRARREHLLLAPKKLLKDQWPMITIHPYICLPRTYIVGHILDD